MPSKEQLFLWMLAVLIVFGTLAFMVVLAALSLFGII